MCGFAFSSQKSPKKMRRLFLILPFGLTLGSQASLPSVCAAIRHISPLDCLKKLITKFLVIKRQIYSEF